MAKPSPYLFCVDCKHCISKADLIRKTGESWIAEIEAELCCDGVPDLVTGKINAMSCNTARGFERHCSLEGRLYEAKDTE